MIITTINPRLRTVQKRGWGMLLLMGGTPAHGHNGNGTANAGSLEGEIERVANTKRRRRRRKGSLAGPAAATPRSVMSLFRAFTLPAFRILADD